MNRHICYSQNVFPAEGGVLRRVAELAEHFNRVREALGISTAEPFPLGLWLDAESAAELADPVKMKALRGFLDENGNIVFTLNAFPYGRFHSTRVKENVYLPDWTSSERVDYTLRNIDILAELLPNGMTGSISTLPGGYPKNMGLPEVTDAAAGRIIDSVPLKNVEKLISVNLHRVAERLESVYLEKGARILLAVEMEPDCLWESPEEFIEFRSEHLMGTAAEEFVGVCYDTCHQELLDNEPGAGLRLLEAAGVPVPKIQLSAALTREFRGNDELESAVAGLAMFADGVYLHQTRVFDEDSGLSLVYDDIPESSAALLSKITGGGEMASFFRDGCSGRIVSHFHVPIHLDALVAGYFAAKEELAAVALMMAERPAAKIPHLEIETYTYNVLPDGLRSPDLFRSMTLEYEWALKAITKI